MRKFGLFAIMLAGIVTLMQDVSADACWRRFCWRRHRCCYQPVEAKPVKPTPRPNWATKVYAVIIVDDKDPTIGNDAALSAKQLEDILTAQFDESQRQVTVFRSSDRPDQMFDRDFLLKEALPNVLKNVNKAESVFCYYLGHGGSSQAGENTPAVHYLDLRGSRPDAAEMVVNREEIWKLLDNSQSQLKALITDACATYLRVREPPSAPAGAAAAGGPTAAKKAGTLPSLLLGHTGKVNLNSSSQNENAYYVRNQGGLFTSVFSEMAELPKQDYTWEEDAKPYLTRRTNEDYEDLRTRQLASADTNLQTKRDFRRQQAQTVRFFILNARPATTEEASSSAEGPGSGLPSEATAAAAGPVAGAALVIVRLPADARLYFNGTQTQQISAKRTFLTEDLPFDQVFYYEVKIEVVRNTRVLAETKRVAVAAGQRVEVTFVEPSIDPGAKAAGWAGAAGSGAPPPKAEQDAQVIMWNKVASQILAATFLFTPTGAH